jgi:hypothetical protein
MLLSFRFANHRSFRDEQQLNLMSVYDSDRRDLGAELHAVSVLGVFGANASGKSNLIGAFTYLSNLVGRSDREVEPGLGIKGLTIKRQPFRLDPSRAVEPSSYIVDLLLQGVRYTYGVILDDERIVEEWLYSYPLKRRRVIFHRNGDDFDWGEESRRSTVRELSEIVAPTALLLSVAARFGRTSGEARVDERDETYASMHRVYTWLYLRVMRAPSRIFPGRLGRSLGLDEPRRRSIVTDLIRAADVGLRDVAVRYPESDEEMLALLDEAGERISPVERARLAARREPEIQFLHYGAIDDVKLDIEDESSGTIRLLEIASRAVSAIDRGGLFLVDEIDASLHPLLTAKIIGLFQSNRAMGRGAQLIFTSHDATLLGMLDGEDVLTRDGVWFVEKRQDGSSVLYPLTEFKPRKGGENRLRRYLNGSYGAIPDLSMELFERALSS